MSVLNRIATILRANVNDLLDRAEDPEKMLTQIVRDMGEAIGETKNQVAEAIAQGKMLEGNLKQARELSAQWQRKAELAVGRGVEDLARECLRRKRDYDANAQVYEQQVSGQQTAIARLKAELGLLESKYSELQRNRDMLLARYRIAQAQERVQKSMAKVSIQDPSSALARMDERIRLKEARAGAAGELTAGTLEARLAGLEAADTDLELEMELLEMKARAEQRQLPAGMPAPSAKDDQG